MRGCVDGFSQRILWLEVGSTNNPNITVEIFVSTVQQLGGVPRVVRADKGTENMWVAIIQRLLRYNNSDELAGDDSIVHGKSSANQRVEAYWSKLKQGGGKICRNDVLAFALRNYWKGYKINKPLSGLLTGMSEDNAVGRKIVLKISRLLSKLRFSANCLFFGQSLSPVHYPPMYQASKGVYLLIIPAFALTWERMRQRSLGVKFFAGSQVSSRKKWMRKTDSVSYLQKKNKKLLNCEQCRLSNNKKSHKIRDEII